MEVFREGTMRKGGINTGCPPAHAPTRQPMPMPPPTPNTNKPWSWLARLAEYDKRLGDTMARVINEYVDTTEANRATSSGTPQTKEGLSPSVSSTKSKNKHNGAKI